MALFRLDDFIAESRHDPYELDCGERGKFTIEYPDGETLAQLTETPINQTRRVVELLTGDQFANIWLILAPLPGDILVGVANGMIRHFGLDQLGKSQGARAGSRR